MIGLKTNLFRLDAPKDPASHKSRRNAFKSRAKRPFFFQLKRGKSGVSQFVHESKILNRRAIRAPSPNFLSNQNELGCHKNAQKIVFK